MGGRRLTVSAEVGLDAASAFDAVVRELGLAWARPGAQLRVEAAAGGRVTGADSGDGRNAEVFGRIDRWEPPTGLRIVWEPPEWAGSAASAETSVRVEPLPDGARLTFELRGWDAMLRRIVGDADVAGWVADSVLAPLIESASPPRLADWLTDRVARRPQGVAARSVYRDPGAHRPAFAAILQALALTPTDRLLEVGCGGGALLHDALQSGCTAVGVDHSEEMVRLAAEQNAEAVASGRLGVIRAEADGLPMGDGEFTAAAMATVFFFFEDPLAALRECHRVLARGGRVAITTIPSEMRGTPAAPEPMASRAHFHTDRELVELARAAGFTDARCTRPYGQLLFARKA